MYFESIIRDFMVQLHRIVGEIEMAMAEEPKEENRQILYDRKMALTKLSSYCTATITAEQQFREKGSKIDKWSEIF